MEVKQNLSDTVISKLKEMLSGMKAGEKLPTEIELAKQFSVGRSTIRESLKVLAYEKMIVRRNEGTFVAENTTDASRNGLSMPINLDVTDLTELIELREILEIAAIRLAVKRATNKDFLEIEKINWLMKEPGVNVEELQQRDFKFHDCIAETTGNKVLSTLLHIVRQLIAASVEKPGLPEDVFRESTGLHEKIIAALKNRDEETAISAMEEYLMSVDYES